MLFWSCSLDDVLALVFEHLMAEDLAHAEVAASTLKCSLHTQRAWRQLAQATGAIEFATSCFVGDGVNPKTELLSWFRLMFGTTTFINTWMVSSLPCTSRETIAHASGAGAPSDAHFEDVVNSLQPLPREARPLMPLPFGMCRGRPMYAEFRFEWKEQSNGEACHLGVSSSSGQAAPRGPDDLLVYFSPSAGTIFRPVDDGPRGKGCFRAWSLEDLWLDMAPKGRHTALEAGVYVTADGQISFFRRGPFADDDAMEKNIVGSTSWESTGLLNSDLLGARDPSGRVESKPKEFHIVLIHLDTVTPLQAKLVKVTSTPPLWPEAEQGGEWYWKADD